MFAWESSHPFAVKQKALAKKPCDKKLAFDLWSQVKFANAVRSNVEKEITSCNLLFSRISCRKFLPLVLSGIRARDWNG